MKKRMNMKFWLILAVAAFAMVGCGGGGGVAGVPPPLPVLASSYANKNSIDLDLPQVSVISGLNAVPETVTFGDFFQEGAYSAFVVASGQAHFLKKNSSAAWEDKTATLNIVDLSVCPVTTQSLTADFNHDGVPDVYVVCRGNPGANVQVFFLSHKNSATGKYEFVRKTLVNAANNQDVQLNAWQAAAADLNGDGWPDVVTSSLSGSNPYPHVWLNNHDDTYTLDTSRFNGAALQSLNITSVFVIPMTGQLFDVVLGGYTTANNAISSWNVNWYRNNGTNVYLTATDSISPVYPNPNLTTSMSYEPPQDVIYTNSAMILVMSTPSINNLKAMKIMRFAVNRSAGTIDEVAPVTLLPERSTAFSDPPGNQFFQPYFKINSANVMVPVSGSCDPALALSRCALRVTVP